MKKICKLWCLTKKTLTVVQHWSKSSREVEALWRTDVFNFEQIFKSTTSWNKVEPTRDIFLEILNCSKMSSKGSLRGIKILILMLNIINPRAKYSNWQQAWRGMKESVHRNIEILQNFIFKILSKVKLKLQPKESLNLWTALSQHMEILKHNRPKDQHHCDHDDRLCHHHCYHHHHCYQRTCECECDDRMFGEKQRRCEADPAAYWDTRLVWIDDAIDGGNVYEKKKEFYPSSSSCSCMSKSVAPRGTDYQQGINVIIRIIWIIIVNKQKNVLNISHNHDYHGMSGYIFSGIWPWMSWGRKSSRSRTWRRRPTFAWTPPWLLWHGLFKNYLHFWCLIGAAWPNIVWSHNLKMDPTPLTWSL